MATWTQIETDFAAILAELLNIPCDWRGKPRQMHVGATAQIDYLTGNGLGVDEPIDADVPADPPTDPPVGVQATVYGLREFTVQVSVETQTQTLSTSARAYLETLRDKLALPSVIVRLAAIGLALVRIERTVQSDPTRDGRVHSEASLDLRLSHGTATVDAAIPYIETVRVTSTALGVDVTVPET